MAIPDVIIKDQPVPMKDKPVPSRTPSLDSAYISPLMVACQGRDGDGTNFDQLECALRPPTKALYHIRYLRAAGS